MASSREALAAANVLRLAVRADTRNQNGGSGAKARPPMGPYGTSTNRSIAILALLSARNWARWNTTLISSNFCRAVTGGMRKLKTCCDGDGGPVATVPKLRIRFMATVVSMRIN